jgi:hypothetical protein
MGKGKGVVASFRLELENQGVGASFSLDPDNYVVGATFRLDPENPRGCSLLLVEAREFRELYLPLGWILRIGGWSLLPVETGEFGSWCFL